MREKLTLLESIYNENGIAFEELFKEAIEVFLQNKDFSPRQTSKNFVKSSK